MRFLWATALLSQLASDLHRITSWRFLLMSVIGLIAFLSAGAASAEVAGPGWISGTAEAVSPEAARVYYDSLSAAAPVAQATSSSAPLNALAATVAPETLPEIMALARALQNDPKLIYEFVHNHIDYVPYFGYLKGPALTLLDRSGNDFDQAALMIALLKASGHGAEFVYETMSIPHAATNQRDLQHWLSVDNNWAVMDKILAGGGIPHTSTTIDRVWVRATVGSGTYLFDPAFKTYTETAGINLDTAMGGYSSVDLLAAAGGTTGSDYVQGLNETTLNTKLALYTSNLVSYLRTNHPNSATEEIVGGREIVQEFLGPLPTSLPFQLTEIAHWTDSSATPPAMIHQVTIQHGGINTTLNIPDIAGHKLAMRYVAGGGTASIQATTTQSPASSTPLTANILPDLLTDDITISLPEPLPGDITPTPPSLFSTVQDVDSPDMLSPQAVQPECVFNPVLPTSSLNGTFGFENSSLSTTQSIVTAVLLDNSGAFQITSGASATLDPGESVLVVVNFKGQGQSHGWNTATLRVTRKLGTVIYSDDYPLVGYVAAPLSLGMSGQTISQSYVNEGTPTSKTVNLINKGQYSLTIRSTMTLTGADSSMFLLGSGSNAGDVAGQGGSRPITWRYLGSSPGSHSATINMALSYDRISYVAKGVITISGKIGQRSDTGGNGIQFETVYLGNSQADRLANIKNNGTKPINITNIQITGKDSSCFSLNPNPGDPTNNGHFTSFALAPGASLNINTSYYAVAAGNHSATISITGTYDNLSHTFTLPLFGETVAPVIAQLWLDDTIIAQELALPPASDSQVMTISINHPYAAQDGTHADQTSDYKLKRGSTYVIASEFGGSSTGMLLEQRQRRLAELRTSGLADTSPEVLTEMLNVIGQTWMKQTTLSKDLIDEIADVLTVNHHRFGVVAQEDNYYVDVKTDLCSFASRHGNQDDADAAFFAANFLDSAMEHGVLEQLQGLDHPAVSTVRLMQLAMRDNQKILLANTANWSSMLPQLINYNSHDLATITDLLSQGASLILPEKGQIVSNQWLGSGYVAYIKEPSRPLGVGMLISGGLFGGSSTVPGDVDVPYYMENGKIYIDIYASPSGIEHPLGIEPVDLSTGAYLYDQEDLGLGGAEPNGLHFRRSYNSDNRTNMSTLGYGWDHGYNIAVNVHSDAEVGLGQRAPIDAAALIVSAVATIDLMRAPAAAALKNWATACLTANWAMDQLAENAASIRVLDKGMTFIKLPDGTFNPPPGVTTSLSYTGGLYKLQERFGTVINFNADKKISSWMDVDGNSLSFTYDSTTSKKLTQIMDSSLDRHHNSRTLALTYTGDYLTSVTDSEGRYVGYSQTNGNLTTFTDARQNSWGYGYDPGTGHLLTTVIDPLGVTLATNHYDSLNDVDTQIYPRYNSPSVTFKYYFSGFRNIEEDSDGHQTIYFLDRKGRTIAVQDALGNTRATVFDGQNHPVKIIDPRGNQTIFSYDGKQNLQFVTNALTQQTEYVYDSQYRLQNTFDPLRHVTHFEYDPTKHHRLLTRDALGNEFKLTYNSNGLPENSTDGLGTMTTYTYNNFGSPDNTKVADHTLVDQDYDAIGRRTKLIDQANAKTYFGYNNLNLLTSITDPLLQNTQFTYSAAGRLGTRTDRNNDTIDYAYTPSGKLRRIDYPRQRHSNLEKVAFTFTTAWENVATMSDSLGTSSYGYDDANRLTSQTDPHTFAVIYHYDQAGNLDLLTYPGTNKTVSYTYDALNRVKTVKVDWLNQTVAYTYDAAGRLDYLNNFNGTITDYSYDNANRLTGIAHTKGGTTIAAVQFPELDGNGNRKQEVRTEAQVPPDPILESLSYTYNAIKTRLQSAGTDTFVYDDEGQTTSKGSTAYTWDAEHRLISAGGTAAKYSYDGVGNRLKAVRAGVTTKYIYDKGGNLLAETDNNGNITRYYIHGLGMLAFVEGNTLYVYHHDAGGNTVAVTDGSGVVKNAYAYTPYGRVTKKQEAITQPFQFVGQFGVMTETNGLCYMRARYYDPKIGRFLSEDPAGFDGGLNLYAYVGGNPIMGVDPLGLTAADALKGLQFGFRATGAVSIEVAKIVATDVAFATAGAYLDLPFVIDRAITGVSAYGNFVGFKELGTKISGTIDGIYNEMYNQMPSGNTIPEIHMPNQSPLTQYNQKTSSACP